MITKSVLELIGNTPLLDVSSLAPAGSARIFAKCEFMNPGGSIKDRPALAMILDAENRGALKPGMTIVEPTAGNTGIGLALVGNLKGYKTVFFVPDKMSKEKIGSMRLLGAQVFLIDRKFGMPGCIEAAKTYVAEQGNCFMPQQFENPANPRQAAEILGPEIERQLGFVPDGMAAGAGTGGTFSGLAMWLKGRNPQSTCWVVEPVGSVFCGGEKGDYQVEGIGNSFIPQTLHLDLADRILSVADSDSFHRCKQLASQLGLLVGGSAGANMEAAIQLARQLGPDASVVTVFPDSVERYMSKEWVLQMTQEN
ncbi:MAG: cysteine synthase family protein [Acidobacteria bacterium]|nr:cysteine synthase family protein [Acidobacteriota bacterium]